MDWDQLKVGDEYIVEWNDGDRQRYRVEEIRADAIVCRRWIASKTAWTPWLGVQSMAQVKRQHVIAG